MKKFIVYILVFLFLAIIPLKKVSAQESLKYFYGNGCPHCTVVAAFFQEYDVKERVPIDIYEIYANRSNAVLFNKVMDNLDYPVNRRGVPALVAGDQVILGDKPIIDYITNNYAQELNIEDTGVDAVVNPTSSDSSNVVGTEQIDADEVKSDNRLTIFSVIAASIVDAVNPCAFAVLIILVSTVLMTGDSKKALKSGIAFATSIFISYLAMGLGLYKALSIGNLAQVFFSVIGWLAIIVGLLNLKDYFWYGKGFLMEVPMSWRPKMKNLIASVTSPMGAFGVGFAVSLFLLPCTSGPYIVILGMLAKRAQLTQAVLYLVLYNVIFVSPMFLITYAVYKGFDPKKAEAVRQKRLRVLHLIAGVLMLAIGVALISGVL